MKLGIDLIVYSFLSWWLCLQLRVLILPYEATNSVVGKKQSLEKSKIAE